MKTPPLLIGASLLFWAWQTGLWPFAVPIALLLEAARWIPWRLELTTKEFRRIWDISALSFTAALVYLWNTDEVAVAVLSAVQWLPIFMFPLVAAQAYAETSRINRTTFFWLLRRHSRPEWLQENFDVSFAYIGVCLLGASAANVRDSRFYIGFCLLVGLALWANRSKRVFAPLTAALFALAVVLGLISSAWMRSLQSDFEYRTARWLSGWIPRELEEVEGFARIGGMAPLKLSGRVVLRIQGELPVHPPELLRQLTFTRYDAGAWYAPRREYRSVLEEGVASWTFAREKTVRRTAIIGMALPRRRTFIPAPLGTARITELPAAEVDCNRLGTIRVANVSETVNYRVHYGPAAGVDAPPGPYDLRVPDAESRPLQRIVENLKLQTLPPEQVPTTLSTWFQQNFKYTLKGMALHYSPERTKQSALAYFLTTSRRGHCEYFASAGVLLLRAAGIPARYATGYSVQEPSPTGKHYIVRERHAHAWALAYINGRWIDFDPTPGSWEQSEAQEASFWRPLSDWWSEFRFLYTLWRWEDTTGLPKQYLFAPLFLLGIFIIWRLVSRNQRRSLLKSTRKESMGRPLPGLDSEVYAIENFLRKKGRQRTAGETLAAWAVRLKTPSQQELQSIINLHYQYRFDPQSLTTEERLSLATQARSWLAAAKDAF
jgi:transglutaminase-like putative cysteine protease